MVPGTKNETRQTRVVSRDRGRELGRLAIAYRRALEGGRSVRAEGNWPEPNIYRTRLKVKDRVK